MRGSLAAQVIILLCMDDPQVVKVFQDLVSF